MNKDEKNQEMTIENMKLKVENQTTLIKQLTNENEELYHQFNHLMIRNAKLLKRVDDLQKIIDDLHIRIEELQLINGNMMGLNDSLRNRKSDVSGMMEGMSSGRPEESHKSFSLSNGSLPRHLDVNDLFDRWKIFPGQIAHNAPNLRKQVLMLAHLYVNQSLNASELFRLSGIGGVTGARYVATLKKFGLIRYTGARKKGSYEMTSEGKAFIESSKRTDAAGINLPGIDMPAGIPVKPQVTIPEPLDPDDL
jgi:predicted transcriptional regulator